MLKMARLAQEQGYYVTILYLWLNSPDLAVARVKARVAAGGHNIPEDTIRRRYSLGLHYLFREYMPVCNRWILADNSKPPFSVVAEGSKELIYIKDNEKYSLIWKIAHPNEEF